MWLYRLIVITFIVFVVPHAYAEQRVATVSPLSHSISKAMLKGTSVEVDYLPPKRLPLSRIASWLNKNQTSKFKRYDAFVTASSIMPKLDFFNTLRQTNIRITRIDMASAMLPKGEKVTLHDDNEYFWLNNNNLLLMLGVLKRDFTLMWPADRAAIEVNYQRLSANIRQLNLATDALIQSKEVAFITSSDKRLVPLGSSLSSDFVSLEEAQQLGLKFVQVTSKKKADLKTHWQIDDFTRIKNKSLSERLMANTNNLERLLRP